MMDITADQMVVLDDFIFKQHSAWCCMAYGLIGAPVRHRDNMRRGDIWSIFRVSAIKGHLPSVGIKNGFFNGDEFLSWVTNE